MIGCKAQIIAIRVNSDLKFIRLIVGVSKLRFRDQRLSVCYVLGFTINEGQKIDFNI